MAREMPIQDAGQIHLLHQRQEHHKVIHALCCQLQFFFHAPQYAREFLFCLAHYANGEYSMKASRENKVSYYTSQIKLLIIIHLKKQYHAPTLR